MIIAFNFRPENHIFYLRFDRIYKVYNSLKGKTSIVSILLSVLPAIIILLIYYFVVDHSWVMDSKRWLFYLGIGAIASMPAYAIESGLIKIVLFDWGVWGSILEAFVFVALVEELFKWLGFYLLFRTKKWLKNPIDYITAGLLVSLGFATTENILYAFLFVWQTMVVRLFTAVPAHAGFGVVMGYFLYQYSKSKQTKYLVLSLGIPILLHGLYDFFVVQHISDALLPGAIVVLITTFIWDGFLIKNLKILKPIKESISEIPVYDIPEITLPKSEYNDKNDDLLESIILGEEE